MISYRIFCYATLVVTFFSLFVSFLPSPENEFDKSSFSSEILNYNFDVHDDAEINAYSKPPFLDNSYVAFKEALAFKESQGKYEAINTLGYLGKFQFGISTLELLGVYNPDNFLTDPALQEEVFLANTRRNKWVLRRDIKLFSGKIIDGIEITESGILASAHLAGPGNVKRYLRSFGSEDFVDAYGTDISYYMQKFSGFDTSFVVPHQKPISVFL